MCNRISVCFLDIYARNKEAIKVKRRKKKHSLFKGNGVVFKSFFASIIFAA